MAKTKLLIHSGLYDLKMYRGERRYRIVPSNPEAINKILSSNNIEAILNFDEKKDHRTEGSRASNNLNLDFHEFFDNTRPNLDFSFNQSPVSKSTWNVFSNYYSSRSLPKSQNSENITNNSFIFNGKLHSAYISHHSPFENYIFNCNNYCEVSSWGDIRNTDFKLSAPDINSVTINDCPSPDISIDDNCSIKSFVVNNAQNIYIDRINAPFLKELNLEAKKNINLRNIKSDSLEKINIKNANTIEVCPESFKSPNLKELDLSKVNNVALFNDLYDFTRMFTAIHLNLSIAGYTDEIHKNKYHELQENYAEAIKAFNPNCKIILNPNGSIACPAFPDNPIKVQAKKEQDDYSSRKAINVKEYKVSEWFKPNAQGKIEVTLWDFIKIFYKRQKDYAMAQIQALDKVLNNIPTFEKTTVKKIEEKKAKETAGEKQNSLYR